LNKLFKVTMEKNKPSDLVLFGASTDISIFQEDGMNTEEGVLKAISKIKFKREVENMREVMGMKFDIITDTTKKMNVIAKCLKSADSLSIGWKTNLSVKEVIRDFQSFTNDNISTLKVTSANSITAIDSYCRIIQLGDAGDYKGIFDELNDCYDLAKENAELSRKLANEAKNMARKSEKVIFEAAADDVKNVELQKTVKLDQQKLKGRKAKFEIYSKAYREEVEKFRKREEKELEQGELVGGKWSILGQLGVNLILSALPMTSPSYVNNASNTIARALNTEEKAAAKKDKLERVAAFDVVIKEMTNETGRLRIKIARLKKEIELETEYQKKGSQMKRKKVDLTTMLMTLEVRNEAKQDAIRQRDLLTCEQPTQAESLAKIRNCLDKKRELQIEADANLAEVAIELKENLGKEDSLRDMVLICRLQAQAMGRVTTALEDVAMFWDALASTFMRLMVSVKKIEKDLKRGVEGREVYMHMFAKNIRRSGYTWLAVAQLNHQARTTLVDSVKRNVDYAMATLSQGGTRKEEIERAKQMLDDFNHVWTESNNDVTETPMVNQILHRFA